MCEETCLICEQCDCFKNGCQGQRGSFNNEFCPSGIIGPEVIGFPGNIVELR